MITVLIRFGLTSRKIEAQLELLLRVTDRAGIRPTIGVATATARRHPKVVMYLAERGVEVADLNHIGRDYSTAPARKQCRGLRRAAAELENVRLLAESRLGPYTGKSLNFPADLHSGGIFEKATLVLAKPVCDPGRVTKASQSMPMGVGLAARDLISLPTVIDGVVQIPISVPIDEVMVDSVARDAEGMASLWKRILQETHRQGELLVVCMHPGLISPGLGPLESTLVEAKRLGKVWTPTLGEMGAWWLQRDRVHVGVKSVAEGLWHVSVSGPAEIVTACNGRTVSGSRALVSAGPKRPTIYWGKSRPQPVRQRLRDVGYIVDQDPVDASLCVLNMSDMLPAGASPEAAVRIANQIEQQLIRVQPWPAGYQSCLSICGDIAALTLWDFAMLIKEF